MTDVLVVGSESTFVRETLAPKLRSHAIDVVDHWPWTDRSPRNDLPNGTQGVILIVAETTRSLATKVRSLAQGKGVPVAEVSRKFSKTLPVLQRTGLAGVSSAMGKGEPDTDARVEAESLNPGEIAADTWTQLLDWATLYIEEMPERSDDEIAAHLRNDPAFPKGSQFRLAVKAARRRFLEKWSANPMRLSMEEREVLRKMKSAWAERYILKVLEATGGTPPPYVDIRRSAKAVFGRGLTDSVIAPLRRNLIKGYQEATTEKGSEAELDNPLAVLEPQEKEEPPAYRLPKWPKTDLPWCRAVPEHRLLSQMTDAHVMFNKMKEGSADQVAAIGSWILEMDASVEDVGPPDMGGLAELDGRPMVFAAFVLLTLPKEAAILKRTIHRSYHLWTGKGTDTRYIAAAAWALGKEFRNLDDDAYLTTLEDNTAAPTPDGEVLTSEELLGEAVDTTMADQLQNLRGHVTRLTENAEVLENKLAAAKEKVKTLNLEKEALFHKASQSDSTLSTLSEEMEEMKVLIATREAQHQAALDHKSTLEDQLEELDTAMKKAKEDTEDTLEDAKKRIEQWTDTARQLQVSNTHFEGDNTRLMDQVKRLQNANMMFNEVNNQLQGEVTKLQKHVNNVESQVVEKLRKERDGAIQVVEKLRKERNGAIQSVEKLRKELEEAKTHTTTEMTVRELIALGYSLVAPNKG